jgi:hypothetical protein
MLGTENELPDCSLQTLSPEDNSKVSEYSDQGCGSGFNRVSGSGSGSRRAKMTHKSRKFFIKFMFRSVGWPLLRAEAEGFFCNLDVLYGGVEIGKLQFLIKKI